MSEHHRGIKGEMRRALAEAERLGYRWEITRRNCHVKYVHDELGITMFSAGTPRGQRSVHSIISRLRREVRLATEKLGETG